MRLLFGYVNAFFKRFRLNIAQYSKTSLFCRMRKSLLIIFIGLFYGFNIYADNTAVVIDSITIIGNKKPKGKLCSEN